MLTDIQRHDLLALIVMPQVDAILFAFPGIWWMNSSAVVSLSVPELVGTSLTHHHSITALSVAFLAIAAMFGIALSQQLPLPVFSLAASYVTE